MAQQGKTKAGNGHSNGESVSAEAYWAHARKLSPREPWRAVVRELGNSDGAAREAQRTMVLPSGVVAAAIARFLALPATGATPDRE